MNTKSKLNCYVFSNLIISFLSLNLLTNNQTTNLNLVNQKGSSSLNEIYVLKKDSLANNNNINNTTTILVSNKVVQSKNTKTINYVKPSYNSITGANLVSYAKHYLGLRYVSGGNSLTSGTDCSGFTKLIFKEFGISLGRTVNSQIYSGKYVSKNDLEPGDLVFYGNHSNYASHVAIYIGNNLVIHESNPNDGVKISPLNMMVYITARRVIFENVSSKINQEIKTEVIEEDNQNNILEENKEIDLDEDNKNIDENNDSNLEEESTNNSDIILEDNISKEETENNIDSKENEFVLDSENEISDNIQTETSSIVENDNTLEESNNLSINNIENTDTNLEIVSEN